MAVETGLDSRNTLATGGEHNEHVETRFNRIGSRLCASWKLRSRQRVKRINPDLLHIAGGTSTTSTGGVGREVFGETYAAGGKGGRSADIGDPHNLGWR